MKNYIRVLLKIGNDWFKVYGIEASEKQVIVPSPLKLSEDYGHWDEVHHNYPKDGRFHTAFKTHPKRKDNERFITAYRDSIDEKIIDSVPKSTRIGREIYNLFVPEKDLPPLELVTFYQFVHLSFRVPVSRHILKGLSRPKRPYKEKYDIFVDADVLEPGIINVSAFISKDTLAIPKNVDKIWSKELPLKSFKISARVIYDAYKVDEK